MKSLWKFLNGKKTAIGAIGGVVSHWAMVKGWIDESDLLMVTGVLAVWTGTAITHKVVKAVKK